jgi:hypothetical protein
VLPELAGIKGERLQLTALFKCCICVYHIRSKRG